MLGLGGYAASQGDASVIGMIIAATIGSVVGAWVLWGLSAAIGTVRLRALVIRYGLWMGFREPDPGLTHEPLEVVDSGSGLPRMAVTSDVWCRGASLEGC